MTKKLFNVDIVPKPQAVSYRLYTTEFWERQGRIKILSAVEIGAVILKIWHAAQKFLGGERKFKRRREYKLQRRLKRFGKYGA